MSAASMGRIDIVKLLFSLILFSFSFSSAQPVNEELDNYLSTYMQTRDIPSISAGVSKNGKILWLSTAGYADLENMVPATLKTVYRIASISKSITAVAVMQLVEQGKINLDTDVRQYVSYLPAFKWKFTTRQLLTHTSGIRDYRQGEFDSKSFFKKTKDVIDYLAKDTLAYEPGTQYKYSTLAYNLLAAIIENVSNLSFSEYLSRNIFIPAGMTGTATELQKQIVPNRARGYVKDEERITRNAPLADLSIKYPGGGIISTSEDLLKFANGLLLGGLIKPTTLDSMLVPVKLKNGKLINYGLGFGFGTDQKGRKYFEHAGGGTGFSSLLIMYPSDKLAAVHLINMRDRNIESPANTLAAIMMKDKYELPKKSLADYLVSVTLSFNLDSAIAQYRKMSGKPNPDFAFTTDELILFGNDLIVMERHVDAIKFFKFFLTLYPENIGGYIGLADAYRRDGNIGLAINSYRIVLRLDPLNTYADSMIRKLNGNRN